MENKPAHVPNAPRIYGIRVCALDSYQCFGPSFRVKLFSKDVEPGLGFVKVLTSLADHDVGCRGSGRSFRNAWTPKVCKIIALNP